MPLARLLLLLAQQLLLLASRPGSSSSWFRRRLLLHLMRRRQPQDQSRMFSSQESLSHGLRQVHHGQSGRAMSQQTGSTVAAAAG